MRLDMEVSSDYFDQMLINQRICNDLVQLLVTQFRMTRILQLPDIDKHKKEGGEKVQLVFYILVFGHRYRQSLMFLSRVHRAHPVVHSLILNSVLFSCYCHFVLFLVLFFVHYYRLKDQYTVPYGSDQGDVKKKRQKRYKTRTKNRKTQQLKRHGVYIDVYIYVQSDTLHIWGLRMSWVFVNILDPFTDEMNSQGFTRCCIQVTVQTLSNVSNCVFEQQ